MCLQVALLAALSGWIFTSIGDALLDLVLNVAGAGAVALGGFSVALETLPASYIALLQPDAYALYEVAGGAALLFLLRCMLCKPGPAKPSAKSPVKGRGGRVAPAPPPGKGRPPPPKGRGKGMY